MLKDEKPTADVCRVHQRIRMRVAEFLSIHMVTLPKLPEARDIDKWKKEQALSPKKVQQPSKPQAGKKSSGPALLPFMVAEQKAAAAAATAAEEVELGSRAGGRRDGMRGTPEAERRAIRPPPSSDPVQRRRSTGTARSSANPRPTSNFLATKLGGVPTEAGLRSEAIRNIRSYIKKAQMAGNLEEVESLQQQLMELS